MMAKKLSEELEHIISTFKGERQIATFLKKHPEIVFWTFLPVGGHLHYVVPEFQLGKDFRADFVLLQSYSGGWHIHLVELEPIVDPVYNKDGTPSKRLRHAQKQIADWRMYKDTEVSSLRMQLAEAAKASGGLQMDLKSCEPSSFSGKTLRDPLTFIDWNYHIITGRRALLSETAQTNRSRGMPYDQIEIVTYDRFLDVVRERENK